MEAISRLIASAREYIGTPFRHGGRVKGKGIDCIGLVECSIHDAGLMLDKKSPGYSRDPVPEDFSRGLDAHFDRVPLSSMAAGDILWFSVDGIPRHVGIYTGEGTFLHAYAMIPRKVVEQGMTPEWRRRIRRVYRIKEEYRV